MECAARTASSRWACGRHDVGRHAARSGLRRLGAADDGRGRGSDRDRARPCPQVLQRGAHRPPHRTGQPPRVRARNRARGGSCRAARPPDHRDDDRRRQLEEDQRPPRAQRRRRCAQVGGAGAAARDASLRCLRQDRWRRVCGRHAGDRLAPGGRGRPPAPRFDPGHEPRRAVNEHGRGQRWARRLAARDGLASAGPGRRPGAVRGQAAS